MNERMIDKLIGDTLVCSVVLLTKPDWCWRDRQCAQYAPQLMSRWLHCFKVGGIVHQWSTIKVSGFVARSLHGRCVAERWCRSRTFGPQSHHSLMLTLLFVGRCWRNGDRENVKSGLRVKLLDSHTTGISHCLYTWKIQQPISIP